MTDAALRPAVEVVLMAEQDRSFRMQNSTRIFGIAMAHDTIIFVFDIMAKGAVIHARKIIIGSRLAFQDPFMTVSTFQVNMVPVRHNNVTIGYYQTRIRISPGHPCQAGYQQQYDYQISGEVHSSFPRTGPMY